MSIQNIPEELPHSLRDFSLLPNLKQTLPPPPPRRPHSHPQGFGAPQTPAAALQPHARITRYDLAAPIKPVPPEEINGGDLRPSRNGVTEGRGPAEHSCRGAPPPQARTAAQTRQPLSPTAAQQHPHLTGRALSNAATAGGGQAGDPAQPTPPATAEAPDTAEQRGGQRQLLTVPTAPQRPPRGPARPPRTQQGPPRPQGGGGAARSGPSPLRGRPGTVTGGVRGPARCRHHHRCRRWAPPPQRRARPCLLVFVFFPTPATRPPAAPRIGWLPPAAAANRQAGMPVGGDGRVCSALRKRQGEKGGGGEETISGASAGREREGAIRAGGGGGPRRRGP